MASVQEELALYPIDVENAEEMERLIKQAHLISEHVGLLPFQIVPTSGQTALDIGCGPGEWVLEMAHMYPACQIMGIDISKRMTAYASACARIRQLHNAQFEVVDASRTLSLPDSSIDIVHARFITGFLLTSTWPLFLKECFRILRPGGLMCSVELENLGIANSQALMRYNNLMVQYMRLGQHCFTAEGSQIGIMAVQAHLLQQSGFTHIQQQMHVLNYSLGSTAHLQTVEDYSALMRLMQPVLVRDQLITQEGLDLLYTQAMADMYAAGFCGVTMFQRVWGQKPV